MVKMSHTMNLKSSTPNVQNVTCFTSFHPACEHIRISCFNTQAVLCRNHTRRGGSGGRVQGVRSSPPPPRWSFLLRLYVFTFIIFTSLSMTPFLGGAPPPKKNPRSAPDTAGGITFWRETSPQFLPPGSKESSRNIRWFLKTHYNHQLKINITAKRSYQSKIMNRNNQRSSSFFSFSAGRVVDGWAGILREFPWLNWSMLWFLEIQVLIDYLIHLLFFFFNYFSCVSDLGNLSCSGF